MAVADLYVRGERVAAARSLSELWSVLDREYAVLNDQYGGAVDWLLVMPGGDIVSPGWREAALWYALCEGPERFGMYVDLLRHTIVGGVLGQVRPD